MKICQVTAQLTPIERVEVIEYLFYSLESKVKAKKLILFGQRNQKAGFRLMNGEK